MRDVHILASRFACVLIAMAWIGCESGEPVGERAAASHVDPIEDPIPEPIEEGRVTVALTAVATGMTAPNWGTPLTGCAELDDHLVVTDQDGILWRVDTSTADMSVMLDVSDRLVALGVGGPGTFDERGFLGVAFHPSYATNGLLYTYTSEPVAGTADFSTIPEGESANHQSVLLEWQVASPCDPMAVVDPGSARELMRIDEPQFNHDGGGLVFGPDGHLYISLGDGGNADDQGIGHSEGGNGQDPSNVLGSLLRIDPDGRTSANGQYAVPADNPFVGAGDGMVDEIYAFGFRNPFRFSFDSETGTLLVGDVGQHAIEEIDIVVSGGNYGWRLKEGTFCFDPNGTDPGFVYACTEADPVQGLIDPIAEYDHDDGIAVIGGFVYHGSSLPSLRKRYVFGDFLLPAIDSGRLFYLEANGRIRELDIQGRDELGLRVLGFGQDARGELYVLGNVTGVPFGETGVVLRIDPPARRQTRFDAMLSGENEVPPVETSARGHAFVEATGDALDHTLIVSNIEDVIAAHIHCGAVGDEGPPGVTLFTGGPVTLSGVLTEGPIAPDPNNPCGWEDTADVVEAIVAGNAYVNVHTTANPGGEIRGQLH